MNKNKILIFIFLLIISCSKNNNEINQTFTYPSFASEIDVNIVGLTFDAMEPFISPDGNYLFFNNINDGVNTKLYYATKLNSTTFTFVGELTGTNQIATPHLDAVADLDSNGNFYWTSTRNYPTELDNLFHGTFNSGNVTNIDRVHGDFNMNIAGWLIMDHGISLDGEYLYFNNARFDSQNCQGPCETNIGVAKKVNSTTFNKLPNSESILQNINNVNYIYYAPSISSDNLELYYTRYLKGQITANTVFEICVAVRNNTLDSFSVPKVLFSETISNLIEAPTLTVDKKVIYYHKKTANSHKIVMRNRI
jgi:WD40-like Beta Propeller Repeat